MLKNKSKHIAIQQFRQDHPGVSLFPAKELRAHYRQRKQREDAGVVRVIVAFDDGALDSDEREDAVFAVYDVDSRLGVATEVAFAVTHQAACTLVQEAYGRKD